MKNMNLLQYSTATLFFISAHAMGPFLLAQEKLGQSDIRLIDSDMEEIQAAFREPLMNPTALLIRQEVVRNELKLKEKQIEQIQKICDALDEPLFSLRDVPAHSKDPAVLERAIQIEKELKELPEIITATQLRRLKQLVWQYKGHMALLWPSVRAKLKITPSQVQQMRGILIKSRQRLNALEQQMQNAPDSSSFNQKAQQIGEESIQQILQVLSQKQFNQWQSMVGHLFDFSQLPTLAFRAPELRGVTEWINTSPLTLDQLSGRVVVVHFWTFACINCQRNYPAYQTWTQKYDPEKVILLGIHTPELPLEKDLSMLRKKINEQKLIFPIAVDNQMVNWNRWSNNVWPAVYLVDKSGNVRYWWYGELNWQGAQGEQWMSSKIEELLAESAFGALKP